MLIDPQTISPILVIIGLILSILGGLWWVKTSYTFAKLLNQPKPRKGQSIAKIITAILSYCFIYIVATYQWVS
jgi:amino acid transporter